jgi:deoxyribonuclease-4
MLLGAHESAAGGPHKAIARALESGCESLQIFVKNNNRWSQRAWKPAEAERFRQDFEDSGLGGLMAHAAYLINLCSPNEATVEKSVAALADELSRCAQLGVPYLVMHPGSPVDQGEEVGLELIARNLERVYALEPGGDAWAGVTLLFENTAGQGSNLGHSLEHLRELFDRAHDPDRFGVCFDTCHAHAAGHDLTTPESYEAFWARFDAEVGLERLKAFHLNDSKKPLGSRRDRHEHIGEGEIGLDAFRLLVRDPRFAEHPAALETPPLEDGTGYKVNLTTLRGLLDD